LLIRKYTALIGIGSATIDLLLEKNSYTPGEYVVGCFYINGGIVEQEINRIECDLILLNENKQMVQCIKPFKINASKIIQAGEETKIPFSFKLPSSLVVSTRQESYYFRTKLIFNQGLMSKDEDAIKIVVNDKHG
jgi:sporulation-control protein